MTDYPLFVFVGLVLGQAIAEFTAMLHTGTLKRKHKREWTYYGVVAPFKAMLVAAMAEHLGHDTQPVTTIMLAGVVLATVGITIRVMCHYELAGAFSQYVEKREGQELIQTGLYAVIRHPMYVGSILLFAGLPLVLAVRWTWLFSILGWVGIMIRIHKEEVFLIQELPGYREYAERTWCLIPHIY